MSAEIEIIMAEHKNVLVLPVAAVLELDDGFHCWVKVGANVAKRAIKLGDSNDIFIVIKDGLNEGEDVVLNPLAYIDEAQKEVLVPFGSDPNQKDSPDATGPNKERLVHTIPNVKI